MKELSIVRNEKAKVDLLYDELTVTLNEEEEKCSALRTQIANLREQKQQMG